jgi:hypothetical protein
MIEWKSVISLALVFDAFITAEQTREQDFGQGDQDEEEDLPEPLCFVFSIRAAIMKDHGHHVARKSSSIPKFSPLINSVV